MLLPLVLSTLCISQVALGRGTSLDLGLVGGYTMGSRLHNSAPSRVHGGGLGLHLTYHFDYTWAIFLSGQFDWYGSYIVSLPRAAPTVEVPGSEPTGEGDTATPLLTHVDHANSITACLGALYQLDVLGITPYLALGLLGIRTSQDFDGVHTAGYAWGFRMALGADYGVFENFKLGLAVNNDIILGGVTEYSSRLSVVARVTVLFFPGGRLGKPRADDRQGVVPSVLEN